LHDRFYICSRESDVCNYLSLHTRAESRKRDVKIIVIDFNQSNYTLSAYPVYDQVITVYTLYIPRSEYNKTYGWNSKSMSSVHCAVHSKTRVYDTISEWVITSIIGKPINVLLKNSIGNKMIDYLKKKKPVSDYNNNNNNYRYSYAALYCCMVTKYT